MRGKRKRKRKRGERGQGVISEQDGVREGKRGREIRIEIEWRKEEGGREGGEMSL